MEKLFIAQFYTLTSQFLFMEKKREKAKIVFYIHGSVKNKNGFHSGVVHIKKMCEMISSQDCLNTAMLNDTNDSGNCYF